MKKILYSTLIAVSLSALLFSTGCKKKTSPNGKVSTVITTFTNGNASTTEGYNYDAQGRLITYTNTGVTTSLVYTQSSVNVTRNGATKTYPLNAQGYASGDGGATTYSYDNNGYLILASPVGGGTSTTYTITNGNVTSISTGNTTTDAFSYTTTSDYRDYGLAFLGKNSVNLPSQDISGAVTYTYSYNFDGQGRVQSQTISGNGQSSTAIYTYTTN